MLQVNILKRYLIAQQKDFTTKAAKKTNQINKINYNSLAFKGAHKLLRYCAQAS